MKGGGRSREYRTHLLHRDRPVHAGCCCCYEVLLCYQQRPVHIADHFRLRGAHGSLRSSRGGFEERSSARISCRSLLSAWNPAVVLKATFVRLESCCLEKVVSVESDVLAGRCCDHEALLWYQGRPLADRRSYNEVYQLYLSELLRRPLS